MSASNPVRTGLTIVMNVLIALAVLQTGLIVVEFFGALSAQGWAQAIITLASPFTLPLGLDPIKTPYGGAFNVDAALTVVVLLLAEWILALVRSRQ